MIVCLGWGSLIWDPQNLNIKGDWNHDGPKMSLEFVRQSENGRLTLVIHPSSGMVPTLWAEIDVTSLDAAARNLKDRECTALRHIGVWSGGEDPKNIPGLSRWADPIGASAIIWTDLPPKFEGQNGVPPDLEEALEYISMLDPTSRSQAEQYVRKAPLQIRTPYRDAFEKEFGWFPVSGGSDT